MFKEKELSFQPETQEGTSNSERNQGITLSKLFFSLMFQNKKNIKSQARVKGQSHKMTDTKDRELRETLSQRDTCSPPAWPGLADSPLPGTSAF